MAITRRQFAQAVGSSIALTVLGLVSFLRMGDCALGRRELHSRALAIARAFPVEGQDPGAVAEAAIARLVP